MARPKGRISQKKGFTFVKPFFLEQGTGIEPASVAWEATILLMNSPCVLSYSITKFYLTQRKNDEK